MAFPLPPWIAQRAAPNPAEAFIQALPIGAQIGQANARLQEQAQEQEQELSARKAEAARRSEIERQKIEYDHAMSQAELGLRQQQVDQAGEVAQAKITAAAQKFQAQQRIQQAIENGMDPATAMFQEAAHMDYGAGDLRALLNINYPSPAVAPDVTQLGPGLGSAMRSGPNSFTHIPPSAVPGDLTPAMSDGKQVPGLFMNSRGQTVHAPKPEKDPEEMAMRRELSTAVARLNAAAVNLKKMEATKQIAAHSVMFGLRNIPASEQAVFPPEKIDQAKAQYDAAESEAKEKKAALDLYLKNGKADQPVKSLITHIWKDGKIVPVDSDADSTDDTGEGE